MFQSFGLARDGAGVGVRDLLPLRFGVQFGIFLDVGLELGGHGAFLSASERAWMAGVEPPLSCSVISPAMMRQMGRAGGSTLDGAEPPFDTDER